MESTDNFFKRIINEHKVVLFYTEGSYGNYNNDNACNDIRSLLSDIEVQYAAYKLKDSER